MDGGEGRGWAASTMATGRPVVWTVERVAGGREGDLSGELKKEKRGWGGESGSSEGEDVGGARVRPQLLSSRIPSSAVDRGWDLGGRRWRHPGFHGQR